MKAFNLDTALRHPEDVTALYLHNCGLTTVPEVVFRCPKLRILEISANPLRELPAELEELTGLEELILNNNQLEALPPTLGRLQGLQQLILSHNPLEAIPSFLPELSGLRRLDLAGLGLSTLPAGIDRLVDLEWLDVSDNRLARLPESVGGLRRLRQLHLSGNRLRRLPASLTTLPALEQLDASRNRLSELPPALPGAWPRLQQLLLSHNAIEALPPTMGDCQELRRLRLARNRLRELPARLGELRWLTELDLSGNRLSTLPETLTGCRRLQLLDVSRNNLRMLPESLHELPRLNVLQVDHNQVRRLPGLPPSLTILSAAHNRLSAFPDNLAEARRLQQLSLKGNPIAEEPPELLYLDDLRRYQPPVSDAAQARRLTRFLRACRKDRTPDDLRRLLYDLYRGAPADWPAHTLTQLFRGLHFGIRPVALAIRTYLTRERGRALAEQPLTAGSILVLLGQTPFRPERLAERLTPLGIRLSPTLDASATHVLLDIKPKDYDEQWLHEGLVFIGPADLEAALQQAAERPPAQRLDKRQLDRLRRLLLHTEPANVRLAVQLLQGAGAAPALLTDLFVAWKRMPRGPMRTELRRLLEIHLPETDRRLLSWRLPLFGAASPEELAEHIRKYAEGSVLEEKRMRELIGDWVSL